MREALMEVIDLLIMYACVFMPWGPLVGLTEHPDSGDTMQIILIKELSCPTEGRRWVGYFSISKMET